MTDASARSDIGVVVISNLGYQHTFTYAVMDFVRAVAGDGVICPDFADGVVCQKILEAAVRSSKDGLQHVV